jgi:hypothetical protein
MLAARPILARIILAMFAMVLGAEYACADSRVALVIGNSKYVSADPLKNPANDAAIVKSALASIGFNVTLMQDVAEQDFRKALKDFANNASNADVALFYFAGHGVQFRGQNYLLPVDTNPTDSNDIESHSIAMDKVLAATSEAHKTKIIVVDPSRSKPEHSRVGSRSLPDPGITAGFAPIKATVGNADGMIVFYSAEPGKQADDGEGAASPFARAFSRRIVERNKKIHEVFQLVTDDVYASTNQSQHPVIEIDDLTHDVILNPVETADEVWDRIRKTKDKSVLRQFMLDPRFSESPRADDAKTLLDKLDLEDRLRDAERVRQEMERNAAAVAADKAALDQRAEQEKARLEKEQADKDAAAKRLREQEEQIAAQKRAVDDLVAAERRKVAEAAVEQARIAREKADKDAEAQRLADEADAAKKKADQANAARQVAERKAAEDAALQAAKAAEEARKLEEAKRLAILEEEARKAQAEEAAARALADACAREVAKLAQLSEAQEIAAIQALRSHSSCPSVPVAANQAITQITAQKAKLCADDQKTFARVDPRNVEAMKAALETLKCSAVRDTASAQIARLIDQDLRTKKACTDEREQLASINLSVPDARNRLSALPQNPACQGLVVDIRSAIDSVDRRVAYAQGELKRLGCYTANPTGRFDGATIAAIADYLKGRSAPPAAPKITGAFVDELRQQDFVVCVAPPSSVDVAEAPPSPAKHMRSVTLGSPPPPPERPANTTTVPFDSETESSLPEFPWPPPPSSTSYVLPDAFFAKTPTMGSAVKLILASLERNGYVEWSFFRTKRGGVALVTRLERINDDGSSAMASERWPSEASRSVSVDLFKFWRGLFFVEPGHYRIIVFILEDFPFTQGGKGVTSPEANKWLHDGSNGLPPAVEETPYTSTFHCYALIYEFANDGSVERRVVDSSLTGKQHLEKSGILATIELESSQSSQ